jgi:hypothetical protein
MSNISDAVATAILALGWKPGQVVYSQSAWALLRQELGMSAKDPVWRSLCANLIKHLEEDQVVERMELYYFKVVNLRPLERNTASTSGPQLHETSAEVLPVGTRVHVLMGHAVGLFMGKLVKPEEVTTHGEYVALTLECDVADLREVGCTVYLARGDALDLISQGHLKFSEVKD